MQLIRDLRNITSKQQGCIASIGNFDGMHLGHQQILHKVNLVILFEPQPMEYFLGPDTNARLSTIRDKICMLQKHNIDNVICLRFNKELASMSANEFIENILIKKLNIKHLVIGDDFSFGHNRSGGFELLEQYNKYFSCEKVATLTIYGIRVSSTHIRQTLALGDFATANKLLGRPFTMSGKVAHGNHVGRKILGFPTANVYLRHKVLPISGVFIAKTLLNNKYYLSIANVGNRPTIEDNRNLLETHLLNFDKDIYGQRISVEFIKKLRDEQKFSSLAALKQQIIKDVNNAKSVNL